MDGLATPLHAKCWCSHASITDYELNKRDVGLEIQV